MFRVAGDANGGTATLTKVKLGNRNNLEAEIAEGMKDGDVVIMHPSDLVVDGVRVAKRE